MERIVPGTYTTHTTFGPFRPSVSRVVGGLEQLLTAWRFRRSSRQSLARLGEHHLRDIGLDRLTAGTECAKPFWRD